MGKIIGVDFGAKMREDAKPDRSAEATPEDQVFRERSPSVRFINFKLGRMGDGWSPGDDLMRHYQSNPARLEQEKKWAASVDTQTLMDKLESSLSADWTRAPEHFQAIYMELDKRLNKSRH